MFMSSSAVLMVVAGGAWRKVFDPTIFDLGSERDIAVVMVINPRIPGLGSERKSLTCQGNPIP
jgi:hypothetical protein